MSLKVVFAPAPGFGLRPTGDGVLRLTLQGQPNAAYRLETSTNLLDWDGLFTTNSASGVVECSLTNTLSGPQRFYRAASSQETAY